jgi:predicted 2-oxoglutarate/Fe(II)-dependent dioxygenase YbiX
MLLRRRLTEEQLNELTILVDAAQPPEGKDKEHIQRTVIGVLEDNKFKQGGTYCVALGVDNNQRLVEWLTNFTGYESKHINSIHTVEYKEGSSTVSHYDVNVNRTLIFILQKAEEGGQFILENELLDVEAGEVLDYDGSKMRHGVTTVTKGYRRVFVAWFNHKERGALI